MFGIGGGEFVLVLVVILMLFGSKEIPMLARFLGKTMAQLKHATNEIKSEINQSATANGLDMNTLTGGISDEIKKAKESITEAVELPKLENPIQEIQEDIESLSGPIKRQF